MTFRVWVLGMNRWGDSYKKSGKAWVLGPRAGRYGGADARLHRRLGKKTAWGVFNENCQPPDWLWGSVFLRANEGNHELMGRKHAWVLAETESLGSVFAGNRELMSWRSPLEGPGFALEGLLTLRQ